MKKFISLLLCVVMIFSVFLPCGSAFARDLVFSQTTNKSENAPYLDENGVYWRKSTTESGEVKYIDFNTDYGEMVKYFQSQMLQRATRIEYRFATTDKKYRYKYEVQGDLDSASKVAAALFNDLFKDVFTVDYSTDKAENAAAGDYLFHSFDYGDFVYGCNVFTSAMDAPAQGNDRYYTFSIVISDLNYYTTARQEEKIAKFAREFSTEYLAGSQSDYEKVKTIYDFVVRNTVYDSEVFDGKYSSTTQRYANAHSAYGALYGNLQGNDYDITPKSTVTGEKVIKNTNQGMAVCEGYSLLFYYLCKYNGIDCRIVDGDYNKQYVSVTDPHEWNYVYLDDESGDGYKWFQVDTTFAAQKSYKEVDVNCYDYFLCGSDNVNFGFKNHQQPYEANDEQARPQLYDWYSEGNVSSVKDYLIPKANLSSIVKLNENNVIIQRKTLYSGDSESKYVFIKSNDDETALIRVNEDGTISYENVDGFVYNSTMSAFKMFIPYLIDREYESDTVNAQACGSYTISVHGANGSVFEYSFKIVPMDMSDSSNYDEVKIQTQGNYTGNELQPQIEIIDGYGNILDRGVDYDLTITQNGKKVKIVEMGDYQVVVSFMGNYRGEYPFNFNVGKIDLNKIDYTMPPIEYVPQGVLENNGYANFEDYIKKSVEATELTVGTKTLHGNVDYSVSVNGSKQTFRLSAISTSKLVLENSFVNVKYQVKKYDISQLNGKVADNSAAYVYTGSAIKPSKFNWLDDNFTRGVDYEIVSYSNNTKAGIAYVTIKGIGNCTGTAKMQFRIVPASITKATITPSTKANTVSYTVTYKNKTLVKGTDYTETIKITSKGYQITLTGKDNFNGKVTMNVVCSVVAPTASGNTVSLSSTAYTYDGNYKKPTVKIVNKNGKTVSTYFYSVKYSLNKNVGTAKAVITFKNGYSGTVTKTFTIKPKGTSISAASGVKSGFKVSWKKQAVQTTGYQIQYSTSSKFSGAKLITVSGTGSTSKTVSKLSKKKKYYVRIRTYKTVNGKKYYSSWSGAKAVTTK